jgi:hypothetical protein
MVRIQIEGVADMLKKKFLNPERIRHIEGGFSFIPHRFLLEGFLSSLKQEEHLKRQDRGPAEQLIQQAMKGF